MKTNLKKVTEEELNNLVESSNYDYKDQTISWIKDKLYRIDCEMKTRDTRYSCGTIGEEVSELKISFKFKNDSLFQPNSFTEKQFLMDSLKALIEGELNALTGIRIENPEA